VGRRIRLRRRGRSRCAGIFCRVSARAGFMIRLRPADVGDVSNFCCSGGLP
jgi:hypothetical protein